MDTVRFGRVLGLGARHAAKTLLTAVDAAKAPHPAAATTAPRGPTPATTSAETPTTHTPQPVSRPAVPASSPATAPVPRPASPGDVLPPVAARPRSTTPGAPSPQSPSSAPRGLAEGGRRFGRAVWTPAVRLSGILWLELTGTFFGLFALVAGIAVWRLRGALHAGLQSSHQHAALLFAVGMLLLFGYFCVSSFVSASRRSQRR